MEDVRQHIGHHLQLSAQLSVDLVHHGVQVAADQDKGILGSLAKSTTSSSMSLSLSISMSLSSLLVSKSSSSSSSCP